MTSSAPVGILLAAGAGTRMGRPKALIVDDRGPWLSRGAHVLTDAGCRPVVIVLGASATEAQALLWTAGSGSDARASRDGGSAHAGRSPHPAWEVIVAEEWASGMGASLRAGLTAARSSDATSALVSLVDLPDLSLAAAARVAADGHAASLRQATYRGRPGHPVLIGRDHWAPLAATLVGDRGARDYLLAHGASGVDCGDLWDGRDRDRPLPI